ncbi:MAG: hypothetical protein ABIS21_06810 [Acidimicrobiales bacterium]
MAAIFFAACFVALFGPVVLVATGEGCLAGAAFFGDTALPGFEATAFFFNDDALLATFVTDLLTAPLLAAGAFFFVGVGLIGRTDLSG